MCLLRGILNTRKTRLSNAILFFTVTQASSVMMSPPSLINEAQDIGDAAFVGYRFVLDAFFTHAQLNVIIRVGSGNETMQLLQGVVTAIFEFGRGFYGNTYTSVLSMLTLTPTVHLTVACPMHD